ncbi:hypothetical protein B0H13DRAFT_2305538 [Mycena leptocephala]|nr:hypothetical protein B0H13DRAFT_2305538 [Mycena leptocephala]
MQLQSPTDSDVYENDLFLLNKILQDAGRSLADFEMRTPQRDWTTAVENPRVAEQSDYNGASTCDRELRAMNPEQQSAFNKVVESVEQQLGKVFFLNGAGGTGKTFLYNPLAHQFRGQY